MQWKELIQKVGAKKKKMREIWKRTEKYQKRYK